MKMTRKQAIAAILTLTAAPAFAEGDLFLYNWTDYTPPDLIAKFEAETGIKVTIDTYDSNETLLAKLKSGGTGYDIAVLTHSWVDVFKAEGLIQPINASTIAGYDNIDERWRSPEWDPMNEYSIPYQWGLTTFAVDTAAAGVPLDTLATLFAPPAELQGKIGMLNSPSEVVTLAQVYLGMDFCQTDTAEMKKVQELLQAQAPHVKVYNSDGIIERMASGETAAHMGWNGGLMRAREMNAGVTTAFPKEGVVGWMDNIIMPTGATNPDNAKKFIEFMLRPENMAAVSNFARYSNASTAADAFLDPALAGAPELKVPDGIPVRFLETCGEEATRLIDRVWTSVKG
jgi:spermidine/putrescine transport system substrate-binding protein